jgi:hypothetical protein
MAVKLSDLTTESAPASNDILLIADPVTGIARKITVSALKTFMDGLGGGGDTTAPTIVSATATTANTIVIVFSESVTVTTSGWSFKLNGVNWPVSSLTGSGNTWTFTMSSSATSTDTILRSYNSATGSTVDTSSNELVTFTDQTVTNSIPAGGSYDSDAEAYINAVEAAGYTMSVGEKNGINAFVTDLKANSLWATKTKAFYPLLGTSLNHAKWNLRNPADTNAAYRLSSLGGTFTYSGGVTCTSGGNGDGLSMNDLTDTVAGRDNNSTFAAIGTNQDELKCAIGINSGPGHYILPKYTSQTWYLNNQATTSTPSNATTAIGRYYNVRRGSTDAEFYKNGTSVATSSEASSATLGQPILICNGGTGSLGAFTGKVTAAGVFTGLSDAEVTTLDGLIVSLLTALGR